MRDSFIDLEDVGMGENAKIDLIEPARCFATPHEVVVNDELTPKQKEKALSNWEEDARRLSVAEEEGMTGGEKSRLDEVKEAQGELPQTTRDRKSAPTKSG